MAKKSLTNIKKGDVLEKSIKESLLRIFPFVEGPPIKTRFARRDYFSLFDFLVIDDYGRLIGIQVSTRPMYDKHKEFKEAWKAWPGHKIFITSTEELLQKLAEIAQA